MTYRLPASQGSSLRVAFITGSMPPDPCGVGDYTEKLAKSLAQEGAEPHIFNIGSNRFWSLPALLRGIRNLHPQIVHIQYPTAGYGRSLLPFVLSFGPVSAPVVATLHEFSIYDGGRKRLFQTFALGCRARIFSNDEERRSFLEFFAQRRGQDVVIPIGSNIPRSKRPPGEQEDVVYFGLLMPGKGVEEFMDFAASVRQRLPSVSIKMICAIPKKFISFGEETLEKARNIGIDVRIGLTPDAVAEQLASSKVAYLPYPDGATEKRGSLLAVLLNGPAIMTRHTLATPVHIRNATVAVTSTDEAIEQLSRLLSDPKELDRLQLAAKACAKLFDWDAIASGHLNLYRRLASRF